MPKLDIRRRRTKTELKARGIRRARLARDANFALEMLKASGVGERQGVVLLVFDLAEGDIRGYLNVDPILAAMALVTYLEKVHPRTKNPREKTPQRNRPKRKRTLGQGKDSATG